MADPLNIEAILGEGGDAPKTDEGEPPEGDGTQKSSQDSKSKETEVMKNLQEQFRQQSEEMKTLKTTNEKMEKFVNRITGADEETKKKIEEAMERKQWDEDTPNKVREAMTKMKDNFDQQIDVIRQEKALEGFYKEIEGEYDVDMSSVASKLIPVLGHFSTEARRDNPKEVLINALKIVGEAKKRDESIPNYEEGGGSTKGGKMSKTQVQKETEAIKTRIFGGASTKKKTNVFGINTGG